MNKKEQETKLNRPREIIMLVVWIIIIVIVIVYVWIQSLHLFSDTKVQDYNLYDKHLALIGESGNDTFWDSIYNSATDAGRENGIYIERFGKNLAVNYSKNELLQMAIQASVDGIIVVADESEETTKLIDEAVSEEIPVVTILSDCTGSKRQSYVGVNNYNVGQEYGNKIIEAYNNDHSIKTDKILVVMNPETEKASGNLILLGIRETIDEYFGAKSIVDTASIENGDDFAMEEYMRDIFLEKNELPDVLVCLDPISTSLAYQAAVDYNHVGDCMILGYYDSESILSAVSKGVISYTLSLDTAQIGKLAVEALEDYYQTGYTNGYMAVDMKMIDRQMADTILNSEDEVQE